MAQDPYKYFRVEAAEIVEALGKAALVLEKAPSTDLVAQVLRLAHTLKGAARVVKQREIADLSHALEEAVAPFRTGDATLPKDRVETVFSLVDGMTERLRALDARPAATETIGSAVAPAEAAPVHLAPQRVDGAELDEVLEGVAELHAHLAPARRAAIDLERARALADLLAEQLVRARAGDGRIEHATSMAEELRSIVGGAGHALASSVEQIDRELDQVRGSAEQLRLVPASVMFTALERVARDVAQSAGKAVTFEARGGDVRLDAHALAVAQSALVQVVRNAVAHGIEPAAERARLGKPASGLVSVEVARRGRFVVLVGSDDGRGVDLEAVRRVARQRGLLPADGARLDAAALIQLLLGGAGVTTSAAVTADAGRGIGLDVVREAAEKLGGTVTVRTEPGRGTTAEIVAPLRIASIEGLRVAASGLSALVPLDAVREAVRVAASAVAQTGDGASIVHGGRSIPFYPLSFAFPRRAARPAERPAWTALVVEAAGVFAAIGVDAILGVETALVRPLPDFAPASPVVAGASLDAEGNPRLVLDPEALVREAHRGRAIERHVEPVRAPILVVDDSLTTRMLERSILESAGYDVDVATSGEEGLEKAATRRYGLFLVDIEMPGIDGFTFIERTRADPALRDVPAILVSSRNSPEDRRRGEEVGAMAYMVKSDFDQTALLARIRERVG